MKRFRPRLGGLRTRLVIAFVLVALISTVTATALAYRESRSAVLQRTQDAFQADLRERVDSVAPDFDMPPDMRTLTALADSVSSGLSGAPLVVTRYQDLTASSDGLADRTRITPELRASVRSSGRTRFQRVEYRGRPYLVVGTPVSYEGGRASGLEVFAVTSLRAEEEHTAALLDSVRGGLLPVLGLAAVLALLAAGTVLRPVRELGRATRRLAEGDLDSRVEVRGRDELARLAADFNTTADALQRSVTDLRDQEARARRFVADVSHELRTPLTAMTMVTTVLDEDAAQLPTDAARAARTVSDETARLARLVEDLMEMSRFDSGAARLDAAETDLARIIHGTLELRGWTGQVAARLPEGIRAVVDRRRVDVAVANLVGNALRHGEWPVTVTLSADADRVTVEVTDRGPGLPPDAVGQVFDRFYKADSARTRSEGSGLGTAIALENARLHGGTIEAANRPAEEGGGAVFTLRLPRHPRQRAGRDSAGQDFGARAVAADGGAR
ncbi:HAMP domain-containing histidine kinase [Streptomyces sp. 110]|uniref:histidine kinase n=1 Tax=Streptomyces endocoffeicus TaxID=2898945 RepID=A0ABS1PVY3_9ACTN|nr:HAMP domain-containing sensor histidine kinase [Streptomyces endocoffeicus]MBL1116601.1 HAMP domain-containing histidine kinase [Streptomyces endocoffeicus]